MSRHIEFNPAWDKRRTNHYGVHGVDLRFVLRGPKGAVQFCIFTNWHLPEVTEELKGRRYDAIQGDYHWMERPMPSDLGYHSPVPLYDGQGIVTEECPYLDGKPCFYDGSGLNAEPVFERLLREGDAGVWDALEKYYERTFDEPWRPL